MDHNFLPQPNQIRRDRMSLLVKGAPGLTRPSTTECFGFTRLSKAESDKYTFKQSSMYFLICPDKLNVCLYTSRDNRRSVLIHSKNLNIFISILSYKSKEKNTTGKCPLSSDVTK